MNIKNAIHLQTKTTIPHKIKPAPINNLSVKGSPKIRNDSSKVTTMLALSIEAT